MTGGAAARAASRPAAAGPVVVIIPSYRQPHLMVEAIESALAQAAPFPVGVVVVNDGCPMPETRRLARAYAAADPRLRYVETPNGGLSAARNRGLAAALSIWPDLTAVYFLDADNRLSPGSLAIAAAALDAHPDRDWVYPNIEKFGIAWAGHYEAPYCPLTHLLLDNICEAGSLVGRRLIDRGLRFDETMKRGYEDWDFWLQALATGARGVGAPIGLHYRRRAESMVSGSTRDREVLLDYLQTKHKALYRPRALLAMEAEVAPRFALWNGADRRVAPALDPARPGAPRALADLFRWLALAPAEPETVHLPPYLLILPDPVSAALLARKALHGLVHLLEEAAETTGVALAETLDGTGMRLRHAGPADAAGAPAAMLIDTDVLRRAAQAARTMGPLAAMEGMAPPSRVTIEGVALTPAPRDPRASLAALLGLAAAALPARVPPRRAGRLRALPERREIVRLVRRRLAVPAAPARLLDPARRHVAFVLPYVAFGGVEKMAFALAGEMRAQGWLAHLVLVGDRPAALPPETLALFETVAFIGDPAMPLHGGGHRHVGHDVTLEGDAPDDFARLRAAVIDMDLVINAHVAHFSAAAAALRRSGVAVATHLHVVDQSPLGRPVGHPYAFLAFEHGHDAVIACSHGLADDLVGLGVPRAKIHVIENVASVAIGAPARARLLAERGARAEAGAPLHVLFAGRLDRQKGVDRLIALIQRRLPGLTWRVVGAEVVEASGSPVVGALAELGVAIEAPRETAEAMRALLAWADVLVLPSLWEGAPLAILEAQRMGVWPIATDVGAVAELIEDGRTGYLVEAGSDAAVVSAMAERLGRLLADRAGHAARAGALEDPERPARFSTGVTEFVSRLGFTNPADFVATLKRVP